MDQKENVKAAGDSAAMPAERKPSQDCVKSIVLTGTGGYDRLKVRTGPKPKLNEDEVLVRVKACGLNFAELGVRQGLYDRPIKPPCVLGLECSGIVEEVGAGVTKTKVGDRVICLKDFGLWTELAALPEQQCFPMPEGMSFEEGAAIPVNYVTAYLMLFDFGNLRQRKSVLIHMAAGGVGWAATQLCKTVPDVTVFGTASGFKHKAMQENGVHHTIDYHTTDYVEEILKISPKGVDIVLDPLSGTDAAKGFNLLKPMGKIVHFGMANMIRGEVRSIFSVAKTWWQMNSISPMELISKNKAICGFHLGHLVGEVDLISNVMLELLELYKQGKIKPKIDSVWPFEQVGRAMAQMHDRKNIGKCILSPEQPADADVPAATNSILEAQGSMESADS